MDGIRIDQQQFMADLNIPAVPNGPEVNKNDDVDQEGRTALRRIVGQANWTARRSQPDVNFDLMELSMKFNNAMLLILEELRGS